MDNVMIEPKLSHEEIQVLAKVLAVEYKIPTGADLIAGVIRYVKLGIPTGDFLREVLSNNLMQAFGRASPNSVTCMQGLLSVIYNEIPSNAHGSPEIYEAWIDNHPHRYDEVSDG